MQLARIIHTSPGEVKRRARSAAPMAAEPGQCGFSRPAGGVVRLLHARDYGPSCSAGLTALARLDDRSGGPFMRVAANGKPMEGFVPSLW